MTGSDRPARVLLVDDRRDNLLALEAILQGLPVQTVGADSGEDALKHLLVDDFALILLDAQMPTMERVRCTKGRLVRTMVQEARIPLLEAVRMILSTPAAILGLSARKGSLERGKDADIVIFDEDIRIQFTIIKGELVYAHG